MERMDDICEWVGLSKNPVEAQKPDSNRSAFYKTLDVEGTDHWRLLASIPEQKLEDAIGKILVNGEPASLGAQSKMGMVGRISRILGGVQESTETINKRKQTTDALAQKQLSDTGVKRRKVALAETVDQVSKEEVELIHED